MRAMSITGSIKNNQAKTKSIDADLVVRAQENIQGFEALYNKYYEKILRYVYQRVTTKEEAYDVTSQVFLKAMQSINKYEDRGLPFSSWLYRIAKSEVYQYLREKSKSQTFCISEDQIENLVDEVEEHGITVTNEDLIKWLSEIAEDDLPYIEMRFLEQRSFKEIGEILNVTENNAKVKTHRIMAKLKNKLSK